MSRNLSSQKLTNPYSRSMRSRAKMRQIRFTKFTFKLVDFMPFQESMFVQSIQHARKRDGLGARLKPASLRCICPHVQPVMGLYANARRSLPSRKSYWPHLALRHRHLSGQLRQKQRKICRHHTQLSTGLQSQAAQGLSGVRVSTNCRTREELTASCRAHNNEQGRLLR